MNPRLLDQINAATVVSFDIFDTALLRRIATPKSVFALVETEANRKWPDRKIPYYQWRIKAEQICREQAHKQTGSWEVAMDAIFDSLVEHFQVPHAHAKQLQELEREVEQHLLVCNPNVLPIYKAARKAGKRIIFLSDMYLPPKDLHQALENAGYTDYENLFVSHELGVSKRSGHAYEAVPEKLGVKPESILHIGDDEISDIKMARKAGWQTYFVKRSAENSIADMGMPQLAEQDPVKAIIRGLIQNRLFSAGALTSEEKEENFWENIGFSAVGTLYLGFAQWLAKQLKQDGIERVLFLSRDGYIMKRTYDLLRERDTILPPSEYVYASRRAWSFAALTKFEADEIDFFTRESEIYPIGHYLRRVGLDSNEYLDELKKAGFPSVDEPVHPSEDVHRLTQLLLSLRQPIIEASKVEEEIACRYFRQIGLQDIKKAAIVDIGWQGTMQSALNKLSAACGFEVEVKGYYLGTFATAYNLDHAGQNMKGYLCEFGKPDSIRKDILKSIPLFEFLHSAPHGSVRGYNYVDGKIAPFLEQNSLPEQVILADRMQGAALEFVSDYLDTVTPFTAVEMDRETAFGPIRRIATRPDILEARMLGDLRHADSFDNEQTARYFAHPPTFPAILNPKELRRAYLKSYWRPGFLRRLRSYPHRATLDQQDETVESLSQPPPEDSSSSSASASDGWMVLHSLSGAFRMAAQLATMMVFLPIIIHYVGEEKYGVWTLAMAIVGILAFLEFGLVQAANRFLSELDFRTKPELLTHMACTAFWMTVFSGLFVLTIGLPFAENIAVLLGIPTKIQGEAGIVIGILIVHLSLSVPLRIFNTVLISQRFMARAHLTQGGMTIIYVTIGWIALELGFGLPGLALAYISSMVMEHIIYMFMGRSIIPISGYRPKNFRRELVPKILEFSVFAWLGQLVNAVFLRSGVFLVQITSGLIATGAFGIATRLTTISKDLSAQVMFAGGPTIARLAATSEEDRKKAGWLTVTLSRRGMLLSAPLAAAAIPLGGIFLDGWVGGEMAGLAEDALIILAFSTAISVPAMSANNALALSGKHRWINILSAIMVSFFIPLAYFGGKYYGPAGVALANLFVSIFLGIPFIIGKLSKHVGIPLRPWWTLVYKPHILPFSAGLLVAYMIRELTYYYIPEGRWWLVASIFGGAISGAVYLAIFFGLTAPEEEMGLKDRLRARLKRKQFRPQELQKIEVQTIQIENESDWEQVYQYTKELSEAESTDPYMNLDFQKAVWRFWQPKPPTWVIVAIENKRPIGLFILRKYFEKLHGLRMQVLANFEFSAMQTPPAWILPGKENAFYTGIIKAIPQITDNTSADLIRLCKIGKNDASPLVQSLADHGYSHSVTTFNYNHAIDLSDGFDSYWTTKRRKSRYNIRRSIRLLEEALGSKLVLSRCRGKSCDGYIFNESYNRFIAIRGTAWQMEASAKYGNNYAERLEAFFDEIFASWREKGWLDVVLLSTESGRDIAGQVNVVRNGMQWVVLMNFDKSMSEFSPGRILMARQLEDCTIQGDRLVSLGGEGAIGKQFWMTHAEPTLQITFPMATKKGKLWKIWNSIRPVPKPTSGDIE